METKTLSIVAKARDEASRELKKVQDQIDKTAKTVKDSTGGFEGFTKALDSNGKKLSNVGGSMTTKLTLPLLAAGAGATKLSSDFNGAMANIGTLIPGSTARVNELKGSIQDLAIETGKTTADLADGMYNVISAFGDTADSVAILEINAKAAKAGLAETTDAINLTSGVTKAYGDTTAEAVGKASDLALMTVRLGQTTFPELASSMGRVTPLAAALKVSQEELFGAMATFTGVTGGAAEVSTQLRGVMQSLMAPTADMQTLFKDLGVESGDAMIQQFGLQGSMEKIMAAAEASGQPLQKFIGSIEGQTLALAASGGQADNFKDKIAAMGDVTGTTDEAFKEVTEGVNKAGFEFEQARAKAEVATQTMGDALAPALSKVSEAIGKVADWFMKLNPEQQKTALIIGGVVAAIGPLLIVLGKMAQGVSAAIKVTKFLGNSFVGTAAKGVASGLKTGAAWVASAVKTSASWAATGARMAASFVMTGIKAVASAIATGAAYVAAAVAAAAAWVIANAAMLGVIGLIIAAVAGLVILVVKNWDTIKKYAIIAWEAIKTAASAVFNAIKTVVTTYINIYIAIFKGMFAAVKAVWNGIKTAASFVFNAIKTVISFYINTYVAIFRRVLSTAQSVFNSVRNVVSSAFNSVKNTVISVFNSIKSAISGTFSGVSNTITSPFKSAFNGVARMWNNSVGKLSFSVPDIPGVPGRGQTFSMPQLPMLATGGVVTGATAAIIGEGREPEAVLPLSKLDSMLANNNQTPGESQAAPVNVTVQVNGNVIGDESGLRKLAIDIGKQLENAMKAQGTRDVKRLRTV